MWNLCLHEILKKTNFEEKWPHYYKVGITTFPLGISTTMQRTNLCALKTRKVILFPKKNWKCNSWEGQIEDNGELNDII